MSGAPTTPAGTVVMSRLGQGLICWLWLGSFTLACADSGHTLGIVVVMDGGFINSDSLPFFDSLFIKNTIFQQAWIFELKIYLCPPLHEKAVK